MRMSRAVIDPVQMQAGLFGGVWEDVLFYMTTDIVQYCNQADEDAHAQLPWIHVIGTGDVVPCVALLIETHLCHPELSKLSSCVLPHY